MTTTSEYYRAIASGLVEPARVKDPIPDGVLTPIDESVDLDAILAEVNGDTPRIDSDSIKQENRTMSLDAYLKTWDTPGGPPECARVPMSRADYLALGDKPCADKLRHVEWVDGVAIVTIPRIRHQVNVGNIAVLLRAALPGALVVAGSGLQMGNSNRIPDVMVLPGYPEDEYWVVNPPLIAVEVASPSTRREDLGPKAKEYANLGVPQYWTVDEKSKSVTIRENISEVWEVSDVLDADHPELNIAVPDLGTVLLRLSDVFA